MNQYVMGESFFTSRNKHERQYSYLNENLNTDVIIVGGGVTGAILGYYFSKNNIESIILEKSRIGHASTSITTALLQYELETTYCRLEEYVDLANIERSYKLGIKGLHEIEKFITEHGNKCDYRKCDSFFYTQKDMEIKEFRREFDFRKNIGLDVSFIDKFNNPFCFDVKGGVLSKNGGSKLDPYKYTHHLLEVACNNGLKVFENTEVLDVKYLDDCVEVVTSFGNKVRGKIVVVATGYNVDLFTNIDFGVKTNTFNVVTKPISNIEEIYNNTLFRDSDVPYNYFRTTDDNRIIFGGEDIGINEASSLDLCKKSYDKLECKVKTIFNKFNIEIDYKYCGTFLSTKDNLGFVGRDFKHSRLLYCLGYGSNGILFGILGAMMLVDLYKDKKNNDMDLFRLGRIL